MTRFRPRILTAVALTAVATLTATLGVTASNASWTDAEWTHGLAGTLDCDAAETGISTAADGTALRGELLGIQLDDVADVYGVNVTNDGDRSAVIPATANEVPTEPDAYANPLDVGLLYDLIDLDLTNLLALPLDTGTGVLGQYGQATPGGTAVAASGYVTDNGGIVLEPENGYPELATLQLSDLLNAVGLDLGTIVGQAADVELELGAVAGRAELDGCDALWDTTDAAAPAALSRQYLAAGVDTVVSSELVEDVADPLDQVVCALVTTVNGLTSDAGVLGGITGGLSGLLGSVLDSLRLGDVGVTLTATVDEQVVRDLLRAPIRDTTGVLEVDVPSGTVKVDTAALLDAAYPDRAGQGLNSLPPNTNPLSDPVVLTTLTNRLLSTVEAWATSVVDRVLALVVLNVKVAIELKLLTLLPVLDLEITVAGPLNDLQASVTDSHVLGILPLPLGSITKPLLDELPGLINGVVTPVLKDAVSTAINATKAALGLVIDLVTTIYRELFLSGLVSITVNAQNRPTSGYPGPDDWADKPDGEYSVAALRVGVLDVLGDLGVRLYLGQATVGPVCGPASHRCAGY